MATTTSIPVLLKYYAARQNNAQINIANFCEYIKRYAQHHVEEQPELIPYLANTHELVNKEIEKLAETKQVFLVSPTPDKQDVIVIGFYIDKYAIRYQEIKNNAAIPFPSISDLPKHTPTDILEKEQAGDYMVAALTQQDLSTRALYCLQMPRNLPPILFPSNVPATILMEISLSKLRQMLIKEEFHDYFLKKLKIANPGKELSMKNFFSMLIQKTDRALSSLQESGDNFYQWSQLCFFIRQDYEKVKDLTQEDISILQAVYLIECSITFYRNKAQQNLQRTTALKNLELILNKPPYYFTKEAISMFADSRGIPLLGQYTEDDLNEFLHRESTQSADNLLPPLLTFKPENGARYYIYKTKVIPLIIRLCSDARETVRDTITKDCYNMLKQFLPIPEIKEQPLFEKKLEKTLQTVSPALYTLLGAPFLSAVQYETRMSGDSGAERINLFSNGQLIPYSELLMISKEEILTDARILLPFWYTIPVVSWIISLFMAPPQAKKKELARSKKIIVEKTSEQEREIPIAEKRDPVMSRKNELKQAAVEAEKVLIPENSTLERELNSYIQSWNKLLNKQSRENLTEDINSLIRDYMRKIIKTLRANNFTVDRIKNLAETLVKTPGMQKIKDQDELSMYIQLYMVKLIKNL
ncbi:hypothetical protein [Treponema brennaborense]|uniref:Uncharacterized protein n=1 Tax=Treponema brennaborense (strain DSM 12168 / CIP 105900 / DD5/3) TaxID=906968 RepID=F4LPJ3_TREBD|nr:hypothetical protein [Treponema brennaborense]AEE16004.1 hypothetical protein Trebr_0561 [Treponema brennaborense DSM 12168]